MKHLFIVAFILCTLISCQKEEEPKLTDIELMQGAWQVQSIKIEYFNDHEVKVAENYRDSTLTQIIIDNKKMFQVYSDGTPTLELISDFHSGQHNGSPYKWIKTFHETPRYVKFHMNYIFEILDKNRIVWFGEVEKHITVDGLPKRVVTRKVYFDLYK